MREFDDRLENQQLIVITNLNMCSYFLTAGSDI